MPLAVAPVFFIPSSSFATAASVRSASAVSAFSPFMYSTRSMICCRARVSFGIYSLPFFITAETFCSTFAVAVALFCS